MRTKILVVLSLAAVLVGCSALLDFDRLRDGKGGHADLAGDDLTGADLAGTTQPPVDFAGLDLFGVDLASTCAPLPSGGPTFTQDETNNPGQPIGSFGVGDFNEDGRPDIVVGMNGSVVQLVVMLKAASGRTFTQTLPSNGGCTGNNYLQSTYVGYFDTDTHLDVVVTCLDPEAMMGPEIYLIAGDGTGKFATPVKFAKAYTSSLGAPADLDLDGKTDLALLADNDRVEIFWGGSGFAAQTPLEIITGAGTAGISVGSILGSGRPSIAVAHVDDTAGDMATDVSHVSLIRPMTGARTFAAPLRTNSPTQTFNGVVFGHFDSDAFLDALLTTPNGPLYLMKGKADGTLDTPIGAGTDVEDQSFPSAGDLDCDGIDDIALSHFQTFSGPDSEVDIVSAQRGSKGGTFSNITMPTNPATGPAPYQTQIVDLDGDGRRDIAVAVYISDTSSVVRILWSNPP